MKIAAVRVGGLAFSVAYCTLLGWLFAAQPRSLAEVRGGIAASVGVYQIDREAFEQGRQHFTNDRFVEARAAFTRADPARRDAATQFYVAYSYYRQGWHPTHHEDALYRAGLDAIAQAVSVAPGGHVRVDDPGLTMHSSDELKAELEAGLTSDWSDLNPMRLLQPRK
jgi:hypothetical protein